MIDTAKKTEIHTCIECGHTGHDLVGNYYYMGGQGEVLLYECQSCLAATERALRAACEVLKKVMNEGR